MFEVEGIDKDFLEEMKNIVTEANSLLMERGRQYNLGGVTLHDQYAALDSPIDAYWSMVHVRFFRLRSIMKGCIGSLRNELALETLRDLLNEVRFLYASIKCNK